MAERSLLRRKNDRYGSGFRRARFFCPDSGMRRTPPGTLFPSPPLAFDPGWKYITDTIFVIKSGGNAENNNGRNPPNGTQNIHCRKLENEQDRG